MIIGVLSDSHNMMNAIIAAKKCIEKCDVVIFLGDGERDISLLSEDFKGKFYSVKGNCDMDYKNPEEKVIEINGKKIFMCHGHKYGVKGNYNNIYYRAKELGVDIVLFGHTHVSIIEEWDGLLLMNPGSISFGFGQYRHSLGFIEILEDGKIVPWIKEIKV